MQITNISLIPIQSQNGLVALASVEIEKYLTVLAHIQTTSKADEYKITHALSDTFYSKEVDDRIIEVLKKWRKGKT